MQIGLHQCRDYLAKFDSFGVATPKPLVEILDISNDLRTAANPPNAAELEAAFATGSRAEAQKKLATYASQLAAANAVGERYGILEKRLAKRFANELNAGAGNTMFEGLRPAFDKAAAGISNALDHFGPDASPGQVLDLGPEAAAAWKELPAHRQVLDRIWQIAYDTHHVFGALGIATHMRGNAPALTLLIAEPTRSIDDIMYEFDKPSGEARGGRWLRLATVASLRLRTPAEAKATVERIEEAVRAMNAPTDTDDDEAGQVLAAASGGRTLGQ